MWSSAYCVRPAQRKLNLCPFEQKMPGAARTQRDPRLKELQPSCKRGAYLILHAVQLTCETLHGQLAGSQSEVLQVGEGEFEPQNLGGAPRDGLGGSLGWTPRSCCSMQLFANNPNTSAEQCQHVNLIRHVDNFSPPKRREVN
eukprot:s1127_g7.t1